MSRPRPFPRISHIVTPLLVAALALSLCAPAGAGRARRGPPAKAKAAAVSQPAPAPPAVSGAVIAVDPETGQLGMPTAAQLLELSAAERNGLMRTSAGLSEVRLPDGSWMVDLQGRFMEFSLVGLDPLGRTWLLPVNEETPLRRLLTQPPSAPGPPAEER
jgi:hypothetical protein